MPGFWEIPPNILVATLHTEVVPIHWAYSLRNLLIPGHIPPLPLAGMPFDMARNVACQHALNAGADAIFFLDSDVVLPRDTIWRLWNSKQPIISGMYCRRSPPWSVPVAQKDYQWFTKFEMGGTYEVDLVGAGCLLLRREFLLDMQQHFPLDPVNGKTWFHWRSDKPHLPQGHATSEDFSMCFPRGTWVWGETVRRIEEIRVKDRVVNHTGAVRGVFDLISRRYRGDMVRLTASHMGQIVSTAGHRYYVRTVVPTGRKIIVAGHKLYGGGVQLATTMECSTKKTDWVEARDIKKGDWLYVPKLKFHGLSGATTFALSHYVSMKVLHQFDDKRYGYKRTRKSAVRLPASVPITPGLCRLIGYYISEGSVGRKSHVVSFAFSVKETDYIRDCQEFLRENFGVESLLSPGGTNGGGLAVTASSKLLGRLFASLGGRGAYHKHLPRFWNRLNRENLKELVKGYWQGDGWCNKNIFGMSTMSERLARELQQAVLKLGVLCGLHTSENNHGTVYILTVPADLAQRFADIVDYQDYDRSPIKKQKRYFRETKTHFLVQVTDKETFDWEGEVFNLSVKGRHSYTANGVAVHNCIAARKHGYKVLLDTSIRCKHVGYAEADFMEYKPGEVRVIT